MTKLYSLFTAIALVFTFELPASANRSVMEGIEATNNAIYVATTSPNGYVNVGGSITASGLKLTYGVNASTGVFSGAVSGTSITGTTGTFTGNAFSVGGSTFVVAGGRVGVGAPSPDVFLESKLPTTGGSPASSGTAQPNAGIRSRSSTGASALDIGNDGAVTGASWLQSYDATNLSTFRPLWLNPLGGNVGVGTVSPGVLLESRLATTGGSPASSGTAQPNAGIRSRSSTGASTLDIGNDGAVTGASWLQSYDATNLSTFRPLWLNPLGGSVGIGTASPATPLDVTGAIHGTSSVTASAFFGDGGHLTGVATSSYSYTDVFEPSLSSTSYTGKCLTSGTTQTVTLIAGQRVEVFIHGNNSNGTTAEVNTYYFLQNGAVPTRFNSTPGPSSYSFANCYTANSTLFYTCDSSVLLNPGAGTYNFCLGAFTQSGTLTINSIQFGVRIAN